MKKGILLFTAALLLCLWLFSGCSKDSEKTSAPAPIEPPPAEPPSVQEPVTVESPLTGLPVDPEIAQKRPMAFMINNIKKCLPQYGISEADVVYEALTEGGITRLLAVYQDYQSAQKIAWIRSARDYYIDFAQNHDAVFVHFGGSPKAFQEVKKRKIDTLEGIFGGLEGVTFFRDKDRKKTTGAEHSVYVTNESVAVGIAEKNIDMQADPNLKKMLYFHDEQTVPEGEDAHRLELNYPWSKVNAKFDYDEGRKTYLRSQYGQPHIDALNDSQLAFSNIIVIFTKVSAISGDTAGRLSVETVGEGDGYYLSMGKKIDIRWSKGSHSDPMSLKLLSGERLFINKGKTFISIYPKNYKSDVIVAAKTGEEVS